MSTLHRVTVTPALAAEILLGNSCNRPLRAGRVKTYVHDMHMGAFDGRAVHIYIDSDGLLLNGQHTLTAIVQSGLPLHDVLIERGVDASVMDHLDRGLSRNLKDALSFRGAPNAHKLSTLLRMYLLLRDHRGHAWSGTVRVTESDCVRAYQDQPERFGLATRIHDTAQKACGISSAYGALAAYLNAYDDPEFIQFDHGLRTGESLTEGDPRLTLRNWVHRQPAMNRGSDQQQYRMVCVTRAWNAWVADESLKVLKWPGRSLPMPEPTLLTTSVMQVSA